MSAIVSLSSVFCLYSFLMKTKNNRFGSYPIKYSRLLLLSWSWYSKLPWFFFCFFVLVWCSFKDFCCCCCNSLLSLSIHPSSKSVGEGFSGFSVLFLTWYTFLNGFLIVYLMLSYLEWGWCTHLGLGGSLVASMYTRKYFFDWLFNCSSVFVPIQGRGKPGKGTESM